MVGKLIETVAKTVRDNAQYQIYAGTIDDKTYFANCVIENASDIGECSIMCEKVARIVREILDCFSYKKRCAWVASTVKKYTSQNSKDILYVYSFIEQKELKEVSK